MRHGIHAPKVPRDIREIAYITAKTVRRVRLNTSKRYPVLTDLRFALWCLSRSRITVRFRLAGLLDSGAFDASVTDETIT